MQALLDHFLGQKSCRITIAHQTIIEHTNELLTVPPDQVAKEERILLRQAADQFDPFDLGRNQTGFLAPYGADFRGRMIHVPAPCDSRKAPPATGREPAQDRLCGLEILQLFPCFKG
ncbi:hypothetical protein ACS5UA_08955 [Brucella sp. RRSP16]|uniref:hypothetical protein n=1 Tax=Brucella sp. RRSP16 TaxID=3453707 RepID=UPI003FCCA25B